jgi:RNA polymerase sigma-70 factor (ECF subfamily)
MDASEFDELYAVAYRRLTTQVYAMVGSSDEAEECVQEAFARAWQHLGRLDRVGNPEAWVRKTAYRLAVSRFRRLLLSRRSPDRALAADPRPESASDARVTLVAALRTLPEAQRRALVLHHLADLSVADVARETGAAEGTVKAQLSRGRAALAELLTDSPGFAGTVEEGAQHA